MRIARNNTAAASARSRPRSTSSCRAAVSALKLEGVRSQFFFNMLLANTLEGFFADPIYGGNRDKAGWKLVGFPGVAAVYTAHVDPHGVPYNAVPVSSQEVVDNLAQVDEHGHPKHLLLTRKDEAW